MKNLVMILSVALFSISMSAQEVTPSASSTGAKAQPTATAKKACCSKDHKDGATGTASAEEKKTCDKNKKGGCCAKKA